jgi:GntR family transcriptional repressor for pyruvate dehydrogenase complex
MTDIDIYTTIESKQSLVDRVVQQITQLIMDRKLKPGMKLPPELKLAEMIGVSRTVIREAIQILTAKGFVETRHGIGSMVRNAGSDQLSEQLSILLHMKGVTLDHLHQVRTILEVEIAGIAAEHATDEEIEELGRLVEKVEATVDSPIESSSIDGEFHNYLARMSHNPLLTTLLEPVNDLLRQVRLSVAHYPNLLIKAIPDHRRILERLKHRDSTGARQVMREHLEHAREIQQVIEDPL